MDMFKLGQMLGNAYGNLWTANANKREDKQAEEIRNNMQKQAEEALNPYGQTYNIPGNPSPNSDDITKAINEQLGPDEQITWNDMPNKPMDIGITKEGNYFIKGNVDLKNRPRVKNEDGSISTVRSMSFAPQEGGPEVLIPTVSKDGRIMNDNEAIDNYYKTGEHLGVFKTPGDANTYADRIHNAEAAKLANSGLNWRPQFTAEDFDKAMRDKGIGKDARTRALAEYKTDLAAQAQKEMLPDIVKAINQGRTGDALMAMMQYKKYDPETVGMLAKDYQNAVQFNRQKELQELALNNKLTLQNNAYQNKVAYKGLGDGGNTSGGKTTKPTYKAPTIAQLNSAIAKKQKEIDAAGNEADITRLTTQRQDLENQRTAVEEGTYGDYIEARKGERDTLQAGMNPGDWNSVATFANYMIYDQGIPVHEVMNTMKKELGANNPMFQALEASYKDEEGRYTLGG